MIDEMNILDTRKVCRNPIESTWLFPLLVIRSCCDHREGDSSFFEELDSEQCSWYDGNTQRIESTLTIALPDMIAIYLSQCRVESWEVIFRDVFEGADREELTLRVSDLEHPHNRTRESLVEIQSDVCMVVPVEGRNMWHVGEYSRDTEEVQF